MKASRTTTPGGARPCALPTAAPRKIQLDADAVVLRQDPASPHPRAGTELDPSIPLDANHNPEDARLDTNRLQLSARRSRCDW